MIANGETHSMHSPKYEHEDDADIMEARQRTLSAGSSVKKPRLKSQEHHLGGKSEDTDKGDSFSPDSGHESSKFDSLKGGRSRANKRYFNEKIDKDLVLGIAETQYFSNLTLRHCTVEKDLPLWRRLCSRQVQIEDLKLDYTDLRSHTTKGSTLFPKFLVQCQIKRLSLMSCQLSSTNIAEIVKGITSERKSKPKVKLRSIVLKHNDIETEGLQEIAKLVNFLCKMDEVDLTNCRLTDSSLEKFKDSLEDGKEIHVLNMSQNFAFSPAGMTHLATIAMKCQTEELLMTSCGLEDKHIDGLATSLQKVLVKNLDLSRNVNVSEDAIIILADKCNELKTIYLHECGYEREEENKLRGKLRTGVKVEFGSVMH